MGTSEHSGRLLTGLTFPAGDPVDASFARDYMVNNANHLADEHGQVRVAWVSSATAYSGGQGYIQPTTLAITNSYRSYVKTNAWPIPIRQDDSSYRMRIRLAFAASAVAGTVTFRVVLAPLGASEGFLLTAPDEFSYEASATTTAVAWRTGVSKGPLANATQIYLTAARAAGFSTLTSTIADVGGAPTVAAQTLVALHIFAKTTHLSSQPRLYGVYAAEWIGAPGV